MLTLGECLQSGELYSVGLLHLVQICAAETLEKWNKNSEGCHRLPFVFGWKGRYWTLTKPIVITKLILLQTIPTYCSSGREFVIGNSNFKIVNSFGYRCSDVILDGSRENRVVRRIQPDTRPSRPIEWLCLWSSRSMELLTEVCNSRFSFPIKNHPSVEACLTLRSASNVVEVGFHFHFCLNKELIGKFTLVNR